MNSSFSEQFSVSSESNSFGSFEDIIENTPLPDLSPKYQIEREIDFSLSNPNAPSIRYFIGRSQSLNCQVFIKNVKLSTDKMQEYQNEIFFLSKIQHKNVIHLIDHFIIGDDGYIIEEYAAGKDLYDVLCACNWDLDEKYQIQLIFQMLMIINCLQENKISHNDIKCENIVFLVDDISELFSSKTNFMKSLRLIDFGSTKCWNSEKSDMRGTFKPPEYLSDRILSETYDIWSLGEMIYFMVTKTKLILWNGECYTIKKCYFEEYQWEKFSPAFKSLVQEMLTFDFTKRPFAQDLLIKYFSKNTK